MLEDYTFIIQKVLIELTTLDIYYCTYYITHLVLYFRSWFLYFFRVLITHGSMTGENVTRADGRFSGYRESYDNKISATWWVRVLIFDVVQEGGCVDFVVPTSHTLYTGVNYMKNPKRHVDLPTIWLWL